MSLERLGTIMKGSSGAVRRPGREIDTLARLGRDTNLRALWEPTGRVATEDMDMLSKGLGLSHLPQELASKLPGARAAQRTATRMKPSGNVGALTAAGTAARPLQPTEE